MICGRESDGKAVPDLKNNLFPRFVTYRKTSKAPSGSPPTHASTTSCIFRKAVLHIRMTVRYKNYKHFGSTIRLGASKEIPVPPDSQTPPQK